MDYKVLKDKTVRWIQDWFSENGPESPAVIGISGGKDSTIVAALCVEALGAGRVIGVSIPDTDQDSLEAKAVADTLGIKLYIFPIAQVTDEFRKKCNFCMGSEKTAKIGEENLNQSEQNLPARLRMCVLYYISQQLGGRVANTCNLSEDYIGYCSRWGDEVGDFSPLGKLTVTETRGIGEALGLPRELVWKVPDDGLPHSKPDEEKFGFSYEELDSVIRTGDCRNYDSKNKIMNMHWKSRFKWQSLNLPTFNPRLYVYCGSTHYYGD